MPDYHLTHLDKLVKSPFVSFCLLLFAFFNLRIEKERRNALLPAALCYFFALLSACCPVVISTLQILNCFFPCCR
jgi:hypothetical protein